MAITIKGHRGQANRRVACSGTESHTCSGPPLSGNGNCQGIYVRQVAGATGTWRFIEERNTPGVASPTSYSYLAGI